MQLNQTEIRLVAQVENVKPVKSNPNKGEFFEGSLLLIPFCFLCIWTIAILARVPKFSSKERLVLKQHSKIPCRGCRFFNSNPYLRCAIRPVDALTEQAIDCSDYCGEKSEAAK